MNFLRIKQTIPEVFSILGGLLGFVLALTRVVMIAINKNLFEIELINKVFSDSSDDGTMASKLKAALQRKYNVQSAD
jgi:hypothetical protein